jgi:hypothetical protein
MSALRPRPLTEERKATHGDWERTARIAQALKAVIHREIGAPGEIVRGRVFGSAEREALDMILAKIARIVSGDPHHPDHWNDIAGYALLGKGETR